MHRIALGKQICNPIALDETVVVQKTPVKTAPDEPTDRLRESMIALAEKLDSDLQPASDSTESSLPLDSALLAMADTLNSIERDGTPATSANGKGGKHYLVIGRYRAFNEAEIIRERHATLGTKVRMILHEGDLLYQVTAGPFSRPAADELKAKLDGSDQSPRIALLCSDSVTPAPCSGGATQLTTLPLASGQFTK